MGLGNSILELLRRRANPPSFAPPEEEPPIPEDFLGMPRNSSLDAFREHLSNRPEYESPGIGRGILATLAGGLTAYGGGKGYQLGMDVLEAPNRRKMASYEAEGRGLEDLANLEQKGIHEETLRGIAQDKIGLGQDKLEIEREKNKIRIQQNDDDFKVRMRNAKTAEDRARIAEDHSKKQYDLGQNSNETRRFQAETQRTYLGEKAKSERTRADAFASNSDTYKRVTNTGISASEEDKLYKMVAEKLSLKYPQFNKYINRDTQLKFIGVKPAPELPEEGEEKEDDFDRNEYNEFLSAITAGAEEFRKRRKPVASITPKTPEPAWEEITLPSGKKGRRRKIN